MEGVLHEIDTEGGGGVVARVQHQLHWVGSFHMSAHSHLHSTAVSITVQCEDD